MIWSVNFLRMARYFSQVFRGFQLNRRLDKRRRVDVQVILWMLTETGSRCFRMNSGITPALRQSCA